MLTTINTRWEATQRAMAEKLTRLTHKIAIQLHLVAENRTTCSSRSRRLVRKLLDTPLYTPIKMLSWLTTLNFWKRNGFLFVLCPLISLFTDFWTGDALVTSWESLRNQNRLHGARQTLHLSWKSKLHYGVYNNPPFHPLLGQFNPVHKFTF
jgi:hypothetical protein